MKKFLCQVLAVFLGTASFCAFGFLVIAVAAAEAPESPPEHAILVVDCSVGIADQPVEPEVQGLLGGETKAGLALHEAVAAIQAAAEDDRIAGLLLMPQGAGVGFAANRELRAALHAFRESGKPSRTWSEGLDEKSFHLASATSEIWLQPFGTLEVDGLGGEVLYWGQLFENFDVKFHVIRAGKFKSAFENFVRKTMSSAEREQTQAWLGDVYGTVLHDMATSRGLSTEQLQEKFSARPIFTAEQAVTAGLADRRAWFDELLDVFQEEAPGEESFSQIRLESWISLLASEKGSASESDRVVEVVFAEGEIYDGFGESGIAGDSLALRLRQIRQDESVAAVVLRVNSPGGSAAASETILREVVLLEKSGKPVVVSMGDVAASGGYWISALASEIWLQPNTITGSIGVISLVPDFSSLANSAGIHSEQIASNEGVLSKSMLATPDPNYFAFHQQHVDLIYGEFLDRVARGRNMSHDQADAIAQGRVWSGQKAVELGLADGLGNLNHALQRAADLADLPEGWSTRWPELETDPLQDFLSTLLAGETEDLAKLPALQLLQKSRAWLPRLGARNHVYARMPMTLNALR